MNQEMFAVRYQWQNGTVSYGEFRFNRKMCDVDAENHNMMWRQDPATVVLVRVTIEEIGEVGS